MIEIKNVAKKYGNQKALEDVSLVIPQGQIIACSARTEPARPL